jgi:hypothetical protein
MILFQFARFIGSYDDINDEELLDISDFWGAFAIGGADLSITWRNCFRFCLSFGTSCVKIITPLKEKVFAEVGYEKR